MANAHLPLLLMLIYTSVRSFSIFQISPFQWEFSLCNWCAVECLTTHPVGGKWPWFIAFADFYGKNPAMWLLLVYQVEVTEHGVKNNHTLLLFCQLTSIRSSTWLPLLLYLSLPIVVLPMISHSGDYALFVFLLLASVRLWRMGVTWMNEWMNEWWMNEWFGQYVVF
jgi:hypothetical protein